MRASRLSTLLIAAGLVVAAGEARAAGEGAATSSRIVNLKDMSCGQYVAVPEADRAPIVWYMAGYYRATGVQAKRFDLDRAASAMAKVLETCQARPDASLRYTVRDMLRPAAAPKKPSKDGTASMSAPDTSAR